MSILVAKNSRVVVQGITGSEGSFHSEQMLAYGTRIVAGVTPGKGGQTVLDSIPVFNSVAEARAASGADVAIIFVPPAFAGEAILEASAAGIRLVVCITEGIPVQEMVTIVALLQRSGTRLVGPNCPGIISVEECKLGIMPGDICRRGSIGVVSRSGTLTYEAIDQLVKAGLGQTTAVGIGGDPVVGTDMRTVLELFQQDPETEGVVIIGEIGGGMEIEAARWAREEMTKPLVGFIAGQTAPPGRRMGHAGAIISGGEDTAEAKMRYLEANGIAVCESVAEIGTRMRAALSQGPRKEG